MLRPRISPAWLLAVAFLILVAALPYLWLVLTSFKFRGDILTTPPQLFFDGTLENYRIILGEKGFTRYLTNSAIIGFTSTVLALLVGTTAAYLFSRFRIPGADQLFFFILATRLGPPVAYALPMYLVMFKLGLTGWQAGVILAHASFNLVIVVWMMRSFFDDVPREVEEAAYLDGCSHAQVFWKVALPLAYPGLVTAAIFVLIFSWSELLFALILTSGEGRPLTVMIPTLALHTGTLWGEVAAASVIQSLPILFFTFVIQKHLVRGLTFGAVK